MILQGKNLFHLTYCTNAHPGPTLQKVMDNIRQYVLDVKSIVSPTESFGLGLWISNTASVELLKKGNLDELKALLSANDLYVFTLNGFPFGDFHSLPVKEKVYLPNWLDKKRLDYTKKLGLILSELLPDDSEITGSISTLPGGFSKHIKSEKDIARLVDNILDSALFFEKVNIKNGKKIILALEPEPFCILETSSCVADFFKTHLFSKPAIDKFRKAFGYNSTQSLEAIRNRIGVCFDACHFAVGFENPTDALKTLSQNGIKVGKVQLSAGLWIKEVNAGAINDLEPYTDDAYLHQVTEKSEGGLTRYIDLPQAISAAKNNPEKKREWRIHFHAPLFKNKLGPFFTTNEYVNELIPFIIKENLCNHLEVETYTWNVLPDNFKSLPLSLAISKELEWVKKQVLP